MVDLKTLEGRPDIIRRWILQNVTEIANGKDNDRSLRKSFVRKYTQVMEDLRDDYNEAFRGVNTDLCPYINQNYMKIMDCLEAVDNSLADHPEGLSLDGWSQISMTLLKIPPLVQDL